MNGPSSNATILVVDDQPANLQILAEILQNQYDVRIAINGEKALQIAQQNNKPDLILLDVKMPGLDGYQVLAELRRDEKTCHIPVIFVTAQHDVDNETRALAAGAVDFISKPINPQVVCARVNTHLTLRQREIAFQQLNTELENRIKERTRQVETLNTALQERATQAETANAAKSLFLGNMSHELRTPLMAVIGFTDLLQRQIDEPAVLHKLSRIRKAAGNLSSTINQILDFTQIESGNTAQVTIDFNLAAMLHKINDTIEELAVAKTLAYAYDVDSAIPANLNGDRVKLEQVLLNLASNAVKFTRHGAVSLRASLIEATGEEVKIRFEIQDTGIGIDQSLLEHIFVPFEQVDNTLTRQYGGLGLGLSINRKLIEMMGGEMGVESESGKGSTFWIVITLKRSQTQPAVASRIPPLQSLQTNKARPRILLVDDDFINQELLKFLLNEAGLQCDSANDGEEAVGMVKNTDYDLVLMDIQMPIMDGLAATRAIRLLPERRLTPVIGVSANAFAEDKDRCFEAGMNAFLAKPVAPEVLYSELAKWLIKNDR
ncbi:response regulator [Methylicorpusculum sp.]|uniref:response regulator n=1 Tax=Methylicorpusculum sp. TaxID=2713644 RepID=UPI002732115B|nr:response regulator [Methylicorpusculum sp.]MDP2179135.1 response regulator [Methylicorpusculum sp.]MDP3531398.1 response regulator [Methylicorpusculum sp.]